jgi:thiol-disulfide isomerase/thioredoxin
MKKDIIMLLAFLAAALLLVSCSSSDKESSSDQPGASASSRAQVSASTASFTVRDIEGNPHYLGDYIGKSPLIINFWGSWCPPCKREMPDLKRIYEEYKPRGLEIIGLAVNDTPKKVKAYIEQGGYDWVMLMASDEAREYFRLGAGVPMTVFLDRNGVEVDRYIGMRTYEDFKVQVEKII